MNLPVVTVDYEYEYCTCIVDPRGRGFFLFFRLPFSDPAASLRFILVREEMPITSGSC